MCMYIYLCIYIYLCVFVSSDSVALHVGRKLRVQGYQGLGLPEKCWRLRLEALLGYRFDLSLRFLGCAEDSNSHPALKVAD